MEWHAFLHFVVLLVTELLSFVNLFEFFNEYGMDVYGMLLVTLRTAFRISD